MARTIALLGVLGALSLASLSQAQTPAGASAPAPTPGGAYSRLSPSDNPPCHNPVPAPSAPPNPNAPPPAPAAPRPALPSAATPVELRAGGMPKHRCFVQRAQMGNIDLLFVGDSITDFFGREDRGQAVWLSHYGLLKAANFGISGDIVQEVLWRMQTGELDGFSAKAIVLMIGTNNIGRNDDANIAAGNAAILAEFRKRQPNAKILLLGVFPRGAKDGAARKSVVAINAELAKLADNQHVFYLDLKDKFTTADGALIEGITVDGLHPSPRGYEVWASAIEPALKRLMG